MTTEETRIPVHVAMYRARILPTFIKSRLALISGRASFVVAGCGLPVCLKPLSRLAVKTGGRLNVRLCAVNRRGVNQRLKLNFKMGDY